MVAIFISLLVVVLSFNFFMISYQLNGVNRLVMYAPLSLFESAIILYEIDLDIGPIFDKEILVDNITSYFDFHMPRYSSDYDLSFYYYNVEDHSLDLSDQPKAVEVLVTATLVENYHYERTMYYEIRSN